MSNKGTINPITGLPQQNTLNPITGLPFTTAEELGAFQAKVNRQRPQVSVAPGFAATTGDFSSYADRGVTLSGGPSYKDYSTIRALNQSAGEKLLIGAKKGTVTGASAFVNGLLGMAGALDFAAGSNLNPKSRGSLVGTAQDWTNLVNTEEWRENSRKNNPHYYTKTELDNIGNFNPFSENNSFTWNFLTDKIFDGIGFLVGTAASIYVTAGTGVIGRVGQLGNISKGLATWRTAKTIKSGQSLSKALGTYRTTKNVASKIYNGAAKTEAAFLSAVGEASIEGKETGKQVYEKLYAEALRKKTAMGLPAQLSAQEVQQLKLQALEAEGAAFYSNVGVLSLSNSIMFRGLFKQFGKAAGTSRWLRAATAAERAAKPSLRVVDKLSGLPGYGIRQTAQAARFSAPFLKTMAAEGSEEAAQYAITEGMIEYEMAKMHDSGLGDIVESLIDTNKLRIAAESSPEVASKMLETFSNPEAREQFVIGSIVGILGGGIQGYKESKASRKQRDEQATLLNNEGMFRAARGAESVNKQSFFLQRMNEAEQAGDREQFEYYQRRLQAEQILQHYNKGSLDLFREMLEDSKSLPENEFKELYGISPETVIDQNKLVDDIVSRSKEIEKSAEMIDELYTSSPTVGAGKLFMSKEEKELEKNNLQDEAIYKNYLKLELGSLKFIDGAISEKVDKIEEMFPGLLTDVLVTQTYKKGKEADYEEGTRTKSVNMRDRIRNYVRNRFGEVALEEGKFSLDVQQNLEKNLNTILANNQEHTEFETVRKELVELRELISQRGNAVTAYNNLNRSPELRDLAISGTKIALEREAQTKRDALVDQIIADTVTPEQLKAKADRILQQGSISEEARKRANDEIAARTKTRSDAQQKWDTMSRPAVENLEGLSPLLDSYREQYLKDRSQEAPIRDTTVEQKRKADEAAEIIKRRKQEGARLAAENRKTGEQSAPGQQPTEKEQKGLQRRIDRSKKDFAAATSLEEKAKALLRYLNSVSNSKGIASEEDAAWYEASKAELEAEGFVFDDIGDELNSDERDERIGAPFDIRTEETSDAVPKGKIIIKAVVKPRRVVDGKTVSRPTYDVIRGTGTTAARDALVAEVYALEDEITTDNFNEISPKLKAARKALKDYDDANFPSSKSVAAPKKAAPEKVADQGTASTKKDALFTTHSESLNNEVVKDAQGRVVVSSDGVPMDSGLDSERTVNGEPIITDRSLLDSDKVVAGTTLVLEVIEDDWWLGNKGKTQYRNAAAHIPIYVKLPSGEVLGVLTANDSAMRRAAYQEYLKGAQGQQVTVAVAKKYLNNRNNAVVELQDGTTGTFLSRVDEVFGNTPLGVVTYAKNLSKKGLTVANTQGLTQEDLDAIAELSNEVTSDKVRYGQVVALHKDSNGKWKYSLLQTARLTEAEQEEAFNLLLDSSPESYQKLVDEVGLNTLSPAEVGEVSVTYLQVEKDYMRNADKRVIRFAVPTRSVKSEMARADLENGMFVVALDNRTLTNLADPSTAEATAKAILNGKKGTTEAGILGNLIQKLVENEDGFINTKGAGFQIIKEDMSKEEALAFIMSLPDAVKRTLKNKRKQVDINRLNADPSYYNTLVEETREDPLPLQTVFGHRGVIMTDVVLHNGSMYNGIGLEFDLSQLKIGNKKPKANNIKVSRPISTAETNDAQALFDEAAKAREQEVGEQEYDPTQVTDDDIAEAEKATRKRLLAILAERRKKKGQQETGTGTETETKTDPEEEKLKGMDLEDDAFRLSANKGKRLNKAQAIAWLKQRNIPVEFYEIAKQVGSKVAHGYMKNAAVYLWNNAEVGTEYHEAFHYVFRTSLSEKQREGLYKEARKRFNLPNATELELEEAMAEEFRNYVFTAQETGKTLPGKIRKFFNDLWNFIKALFVNPVGVEQFYSLIESNKVPNKYERSAEKFATKGEVYRLVSDLGNDYEMQQQVLDVISMQFVDTYNESNQMLQGMSQLEGTGKNNKVLATALLGTTEQDKGIIADWFLQHSFSTETDGYMSDEAMEAIKNAKSSEEIKNAVKKYKLQRKPPLQAFIEGELPTTVFNKEEKTQRNTAIIFYNVWKNWFDVTDELGNIEQYGWRDAAAADLLKYGFTIQTRVATRTALEQEEEGSPEQEEVNFDKIYDISHFEQDPLKVASKEVRNLLSRIVDTTPNVFGIPTYIDVEATLRKTIAVTAGAKGYSEILGRIQEAARIEEIEAQKTDRKSLILGPLKDYLNGTPTAQEVAALTRFLTKTYSELRIVQENQIETTDGGVEMSVQTINSDRKSAVINWQDTWKNDGLQTLSVPRPGAVFTETEDGGIAFNNNITEGQNRIDLLKEAFLNYDRENTVEGKATQLGKIMWNLSLGMGSTEQEATDRLMSYVLKNTTLDNNEISKIFKKVIYLANQAVDFKVEGGRVKDVMLKKGKVRNFFVSEGSTVKELANIAAEYSVPVAIAYVNGKGKTIYPYNLPTPFTDLIEDLKQNAASNKYAFLQGDESFTAMNTEHKAMLMTLIANPEFEISSWALDTINNEASDDANIEYKKMSERDSLILKLNMFVNQGSAIKYGWIPVSTQETRGRLDFVKFPKIEEKNFAAVEAAGLQRESFSGRLKSVVIRDLVRLSNNPRVAENYNNGFHLTGIVNTKLGSGLLMSETVKDYLQNPKGKEYQDFNKELDRQVKEYVNTVFKRNRENLRNELLRYNIIRLVEGKPEFLEKSKLDSSVQKYGGVNRFLNNYMMTDMLARIEMAEMLRGGVVQFENLTKFYKRMGLIQTPGDKLMQKGEFEADPDYGMAPTIVEASIGKMQNQEPFHNEAADNLRDLSLAPFYEKTMKMSKEEALKKAESIAKQYRNDFGDHTDAQAFASDLFYKMYKQGKGQWTSEDDVWFDEYLNKKGEWKGDKYIEPIKPFVNNQVMENGASISDMQKNSLLVVTRPLAEMNTVLAAMYLRMNKAGDNIHIINTESAKKGAKGQEFAVNQELGATMFEGLEGTEMSTDGLYIPQTISDKRAETAKMNRQIRKVLPTMVKADGEYDVKGAKSPMSGKEVSDRYQTLHEEILDAQAKKLFKELGWDELKKNPGNKEARLKFLQRVKSVIMDNAMKNNKLDSNLDKQLRIVEDMVNNTVDFNVPTYMPVYQRQLQNQIFSLFRSNVYQVKLPGRDLVQANSGGKWKIGDEIRELRHIHIDEKGNTVAAEIMISEDLAEMHGIEVGDRIIMYRIPNQDYSSAVPSQVAGILPRGYSKTVMVAGGITIQTGSDFDIDKLFNLFENKDPKNRLDRLKNELFNISYSILMNKETAPYLFAPLNQDTLNDLADNPEIAKEEVRDFDDPLVEIKMESNYKSAATLVGGYANAIAGMSIANVASQFENEEYVQNGIAVNASKKFILNDTALGLISTRSEMTNERNIAGIVERLSAALDAGSKLIHSTLNDNDITLNATVYLKSIGFGDRDVVALMTTPLVREFVESKRDNRNKSNQRVFQDLGINRKTYSKIASFDSSILPPALNTEELERVSKEGNRKDPVAKEALYAFAHALVAGNSLSDFYRVIAADNLDGMGDLAEIEAYLDVLDNYKRSGNRNIVGYSEVEKILKGDAYRISRAFFNIIDESMQISSELFMSGTKGVREFKQLLKDVAGKQTMTAAEHRFVDRALFYHIFTKEGSPIGSLMQKSVVKSMLLDPKNNLYKQVKDLIEEIPALRSNSMIASIKEGPKYNDPTTRVFGISIENTEKMSLRARETQRQSFGDLLYRPEKYTSDPQEQKKIQNMGKRLVLNSIVTTGLAPSYGTYYDAIPIDFFMEIADESGKTLMQYLREEFQNVKNDERYFDDFMFSFMQNYGAATVASAPLVGRMPRSYVQRGEGLYGLPASVELDGRPARYVTRANYSKGVDKMSVYEYNNTDEMYHLIQSTSITNKIIELNLRDRNGDIVTSSFFAESQGERKVRMAGKGKGKDKVVDLHSRAGITKTMSDPMTMNEETRRIRTTDSSSDISHVC